MNHPAVLFSGGLDSTYVLYSALKRYKQIHVYMLDIMGWSELMTRQKNACAAILELIGSSSYRQAHGLGEIISVKTHKAYDSIAINQSSFNGFRQASLITKTLLEFPTIHSVSSILVGLVKGDNGVPTFHYFQDAWKALYRVSFPFAGEPPDILAPIITMTKEDILANLPNPILAHVEWCGSSGNLYDAQARGCGRCPSCLTMAKVAAGVKYCQPQLYTGKLQSLNPRYDTLIELTHSRNLS